MDSMMYYFGEMQASSYWQDAKTDTMLRSEQSRKEFIAGLKAAMDMDENNSAYNRGLQEGLRLAMRLRDFKKIYGEDFSEEVLAASLEHFLQTDSDCNVVEAQREYYRIKDRFELTAATREIKDAKVVLTKKGTAFGFTMLNDTLYYKDVTPISTGPTFQEGDRVAVKITASTIDGKEIVTKQFPDSITLGEGRIPLIVRYAIYTMTDGQTRQFMTTPRTLFGKRYAAYKLPSDEPVIFTVKAQR